jgi:hypothetical protein
MDDGRYLMYGQVTAKAAHELGKPEVRFPHPHESLAGWEFMPLFTPASNSNP